MDGGCQKLNQGKPMETNGKPWLMDAHGDSSWLMMVMAHDGYLWPFLRVNLCQLVVM